MDAQKIGHGCTKNCAVEILKCVNLAILLNPPHGMNVALKIKTNELKSSNEKTHPRKSQPV
jgi:hypothetical protein